MLFNFGRSSWKFDLRWKKHDDWPKLTLTPEVDPTVTSYHIFDTREVEFTKYSTYGNSYAPDTELAQDQVNRPLGPWHDLENKVISHEPKLTDTWNFQRTLQKVKNTTIAKNQISIVKNVAYSAKKNYLGRGIPHVRAKVIVLSHL